MRHWPPVLQDHLGNRLLLRGSYGEARSSRDPPTATGRYAEPRAAGRRPAAQLIVRLRWKRRRGPTATTARRSTRCTPARAAPTTGLLQGAGADPHRRAAAPGGILRLRDLVSSLDPQQATDRPHAWPAAAGTDPARGWAATELATHIRDEHSTYTWLLEPMLDRAGFTITERDDAPTQTYARLPPPPPTTRTNRPARGRVAWPRRGRSVWPRLAARPDVSF
jgi:hypothetical protein